MKEPFNESQSLGRPGNGNTRQESLPQRTEEVAERARAAAIERVEDARDRAREGVEEGRRQMAERVRRVGGAVRAASEKLRDEDQVAARYAEMASDGIERAASYIGSADLKRTVRDVEGFARRQPAVFFGGAFVLGLAVGRFLQSSRRSGNGDRLGARFQQSFDERDTATDWPRPARPLSIPTHEHETEGLFDTRPTAPTGEGLTAPTPGLSDPRRGST